MVSPIVGSVIHIDIKPLSVNRAWRGRRFKSQDYKDYESSLFYLLPPIPDFPKENIKLSFEFGMPKSQDIDSPLKQTIDIMQKKYGFDDKNIIELHVTKTHAKKGEEFIRFSYII